MFRISPSQTIISLYNVTLSMTQLVQQMIVPLCQPNGYTCKTSALWLSRHQYPRQPKLGFPHKHNHQQSKYDTRIAQDKPKHWKTEKRNNVQSHCPPNTWTFSLGPKYCKWHAHNSESTMQIRKMIYTQTPLNFLHQPHPRLRWLAHIPVMLQKNWLETLINFTIVSSP